MHSPRFSEMPMIIGHFENDEQRYKEDVVVMKFSKDIQHRLLFPMQSGERRKGGEAEVVGYEFWICNSAPSLFFDEGKEG